VFTQDRAGHDRPGRVPGAQRDDVEVRHRPEDKGAIDAASDRSGGHNDDVSFRLVMLRHGQSTWNLENLFTGWVDVELTDRGRDEARQGGADLRAAGVFPDILHTSLQVRAIRTAELSLEVCERSWIPVRRSWRLNERHYGDLQGRNKKETAEQYGADQVKIWRRSYDAPPPSLAVDDPRWGYDARYAALDRSVLPRAECLKDVLDRMLPWWYDAIVPDLRTGATVLVAAHGNSLRALIKHLDGMTPEQVVELNLPTGEPVVYELDDGFRPVHDVGPGGIRGRYLAPQRALAKADAVAKQAG
jgi:2,3-bisphosphoglycerate-dependent phosphoglycerate mutase